MKKRFFSLLFLMILGQKLIGQVLFSERNSYSLASALYASILRIGDTLYLSGVASDTSQNFAQVQYPKNFVALMDLNGNDLGHGIVLGQFKKTYETFVHSLIKTRNNGFALCGSTIDTTLFQALFIQYDSVMDVIAIKEFHYPDSILFLEMQNMVQLGDGSYFIVGEAQNISGIGSIVLLKLDSAANAMWWKTYNPAQLSDVYPSVFQLSDTKLLISCEHSNELERPYSITSQTKFMVIDTGGGLLNQWLDGNDSTFAPYGMLKTKDGGYAYCGRYMVGMNAPYDEPLTDGAITKLDSNFNLLWRRLFTTDQIITNQFYQLRELPDGSLVAAGECVGWLPTLESDEHSGWFVKVSATGDSVWARLYARAIGADDDNVINDFELLPDGGIIGCGTSTDNSVNYEKQQAWLIRLDSMGCLIPGCDTLTPTGLNPILIEGAHTGIAIFPNPASDLVYLLIKTDNPAPDLSFVVYDASGTRMAVQSKAVADVTYLLHVNTYRSGMYFVQVLNGAKQVNMGKFIKE